MDMRTRTPVIVIGVDGGTPTVIERYAQEGALPNIARLMAEGTFAEACLPAMPTTTPTIHQHDIAPTLSHLLGCPRPRDAEGAVIYDILDPTRA